MNQNIHFHSDGAIMDEKDLADLRAIELALQNPRPGTAAASMLEQLTTEAKRQDAQLFPTESHPITGALCFCRAYCEGAACQCWCHTGSAP